MNLNPGDKIKITTKNKTYEGTLMPSKDEIIIKLDSGYNIGIKKKDIKKQELIEKLKEKKEKKSIKQDKSLPKITILHTGGTIASKVDYRTGGVIAKFTPEDLLELVPELKKIAYIESELIANMWSDDLRFCHFEKIAKAIKKHNTPIIIGMGTDNLAVASAALAFAFEEINIPVILVGSQRSSDRGSSDAAMNLICAAEFITKTDFTGVAICMHSTSDDKVCNILPATKTKKLHSSRRDAFKPVNDTIIAKVNYETRKITQYKKSNKQKSLILKPKFEDKVGLLKIHVNMHPEEILTYKNFKGLVIEGTGLGQTPLDVLDDCTEIHKKIKSAFETLNKNKVIMVMTTNCQFGRVNMNVYSKGRDLQEIGIIPGEDMLPETAFVKLAWLLANEPKDTKKLIKQNLRGEILSCTPTEKEFLN